MIAVVDYGAGNLGSVEKALRYLGIGAVVTRDAEVVMAQDAVVLPGVGALGHCMDGLRRAGLPDAIRAFIESGRPFLGICIGLQMLFDQSEEGGHTDGLGVLPGRVSRFAFDDTGPGVGRIKIPHMGWNSIEHGGDCPLFEGVPTGAMVYFVHSYYAVPADRSAVAAQTDYGVRFCSAVRSNNVFGTQFHPEKSGSVGLRILRNFAALAT
ncbi:MAG: imidazole glycerol phosphate synthase subunit HisH [Armatimonadetes bacterium]|nr:imidazole glycerol phosphate synthase subunit HisH [Armatimonadota bacterium]